MRGNYIIVTNKSAGSVPQPNITEYCMSTVLDGSTKYHACDVFP